jgi:hypothetical protein
VVECYIDTQFAVMRVVSRYAVLTWIVNVDAVSVCWLAYGYMTMGYSNTTMKARKCCWRAASALWR